MPAKDKPVESKDPTIAALISVVCMLIVGAPGVGYIYLGDMKKGVEYIIAAWVVAIVLGTGTFAASYVSKYGFCCAPIMLLSLVFDLVIVWDVYLEAKGEPTKLPTIG